MVFVDVTPLIVTFFWNFCPDRSKSRFFRIFIVTAYNKTVELKPDFRSKPESKTIDFFTEYEVWFKSSKNFHVQVKKREG